MAHKIHNIGIAAQIGAYSDAVETGSNLRWLLTSGTPGLQMNGDLPSDIAGQTELGHGVLPDTDPADLGRLVELVHERTASVAA